METTILLVDDHPIFRKGLRSLFEDEQDLNVVGEAGDGQTAKELVQQLSPDVVVMDISMPGVNGIEATKYIVSHFPETKVIALSIHSGKQFVENMLKAGASGYILKETVPDELIDGVKSVIRGEVYLSPAITALIVSTYRGNSSLKQLSERVPDKIILSKLHCPDVTKDHVYRQRLVDILEENRHLTLQVISAPAGYGKSTLASCWIMKSEWPSSWVSMDEGDSDLRQFLNYFVRAVQNIFPNALSNFMSLLETPILPPIQSLTRRLKEGLNEISKDFVIVLDDFHLIIEKSVHDLLEELLRHPPMTLHLILVSRSDPFLPLILLRARGQLSEIRLNDLSFTKQETGQYLNMTFKDHIEESTINKWFEKTEGWVTGLRLAALSVQHHQDLNSMLPDLQSGSKYIMEYFFSEILANQTPTVRKYLLDSSILDRLCGPLCEFVSDSYDEIKKDGISGWEFVGILKKENMFLINLDTKNYWFRYHHLFQAFLQKQLRKHRSLEEISTLHSRTSEWLANNNYVEDAIKHAIAANDLIRAAELFEQNRQAILDNDRWYVFERLLCMFPEPFIVQNVNLLITRVWLHYHHFEIQAIPAVLNTIESLSVDLPSDNPLWAEINFFRGYICYFQNNGKKSLEYLYSAQKIVPDNHKEIKGQIEILYGLTCQMQGQEHEAVDRLNRLLKQPTQDISKTRFQATIVYIYIIAGDLEKALVTAQNLYLFATNKKYEYAKEWGLYLQGLVHFYRADLALAVSYFEKAVQNKYILHTRAVVDSMAGLVISYQLRGNPDKANAVMQDFFEYTASLDDPVYSMIALSCHARLSIMQREKRTGIDSLRENPPQDENMVWWLEIPVVSYCKALLFDDSYDSLKDAKIKLRQLLQICKETHNNCHAIEILSLLALVHKKQGGLEEALEFLKKAIGLAKIGGWISPFVELGTDMKDLLNKLMEHKFEIDYTNKILDAFNITMEPDGTSHLERSSQSSFSQPLDEPLTNREIEILKLLQQRFSNKEIGETLFISTETVKTHLKNIFSKLEVGKRKEAVNKAVSLGILSVR